MSKKVTLKDIADELGISLATVSRALNGKGRISKDLRKKIIEKAKELGYLAPRALSYNRKLDKKMVVLFPQDAYFWSAVENGVFDAITFLKEWGMEFEVYRTKGHNLSEQNLILENLLEKQKFDALLIVPSDLTKLDYFINAFHIRGIKVATFNVDAPFSKRLFYVGQDYYVAGRMAGKLFRLFLGSRKGRICTVTTNKQAPSHVMRWQGLTDFINENNLPYDASWVVEVKDEEEAFEVTGKYLVDEEGVAGIFMSTAFGNYGVGRALQQVKPRKEVVVIGNDLSEEWKPFLEANLINCSLYQFPYLQGFLGVVFLALCLAEDFSLDVEVINLPVVPLFPESVKGFALEDFEKLLSKLVLWNRECLLFPSFEALSE
jgi:LacI family transcriptional regulator